MSFSVLKQQSLKVFLKTNVVLLYLEKMRSVLVIDQTITKSTIDQTITMIRSMLARSTSFINLVIFYYTYLIIWLVLLCTEQIPYCSYHAEKRIASFRAYFVCMLLLFSIFAFYLQKRTGLCLLLHLSCNWLMIFWLLRDGKAWYLCFSVA